MIDIARHGPVFVLRMDDAENRMNPAWLEAMTAALDEVDTAADPVALVTTGTDRFYSNGLDLETLLADGAETFRLFVIQVEALLARMVEAPYITVAACNGHTFAAGALLAISHDLRVMRADRGFFCLPEVDLGLPFTPGMDALIRQKLPIAAAHEAMVTGRRFGGGEAASRGLVTEAVPADQVLPRAIELATEHAGKDRSALRVIKRRMYGGMLELLRNSTGISAP